jgi:Protein of unknown function (DUF1588)/Protein of unknown function (DUF1592)
MPNQSLCNQVRLVLICLPLCACNGTISGGIPPSKSGETIPGVDPAKTPTGEPTPGVDPMIPGDGAKPTLVLPARLVPLSDIQWRNAMDAALGRATQPTVVDSPSGKKAFSSNRGYIGFDEMRTQTLLDYAETTAPKIVAEAAKNVACLNSMAPDAACLNQGVGLLSKALFRRPLDASGTAEYVALATASTKAFGAVEGWTTVVESMMLSPKALFRSEIPDPGAQPTRGLLRNEELAEAIAFGLTDAPPDAELKAAAAASANAFEQNLAPQVKRLMSSAAGKAKLTSFLTEFFEIGGSNLDSKEAAIAGGEWDPVKTELLGSFSAMAQALATSPTGLLTRALSIKEFSIGPKSAGVFGTAQPIANAGFSLLKTDGTQAAARTGLLAHPAFLATFAGKDENHAVQRGEFIQRKLLCGTVSMPPQGLVVTQVSKKPTLRERLAEHRENAICAGCHAKMDPLALPLERFDAVGRSRTKDNGQEVITTSTYVGFPGVAGSVSFENHDDLVQRLSASDEVQTCFLDSYLSYVFAQPISTNDSGNLVETQKNFKSTGFDLAQGLSSFFASPFFLERSLD